MKRHGNNAHLLKVHEEFNSEERAEVAEARTDAGAETAVLQGKQFANQ